MSVYIPGMEMPVLEDQSWDMRHGADGKWYVVDTNAETSDGEWHEIIPVPEHGRLIDADALQVSLAFAEETAEWAVPALRAVLMVIDEMPTIIEASGGKENE